MHFFVNISINFQLVILLLMLLFFFFLLLKVYSNFIVREFQVDNFGSVG